VLGAFAGATAAPGEAAEVTLRVPARIFAVFDEETGQWAWPPGEFTVQAGRSSRDLRLSVTVRSGVTPGRGHPYDGATSSTS
jgi:beta-glucosidase